MGLKKLANEEEILLDFGGDARSFSKDTSIFFLNLIFGCLKIYVDSDASQASKNFTAKSYFRIFKKVQKFGFLKRWLFGN